MYLHIGNYRNIRTKEIVGIFDLDTATVSAITKNYLKCREKAGKTDSATEEIPKSFLLTRDGNICFSQMASVTLIGRLNS